MDRIWIRGLSVSALALVMAMPAMAQESATAAKTTADDSTVVVVTANKRKERAFDVAQTVNLVTGDSIQKLNITAVEDIQKLTPGLRVDHGTGGRNNVVTLRGVTFNPDAGGNPTVDIYDNEVLVPGQTALQSMYDIGNIQVLRGPQGTLRAGTGPSGAVLIGTKMPSLYSVDGYVEASAINKETSNAQFGVGVPIIKDVLAVRVAGLYDHNEGQDGNSLYYNNPDHGQTSAGRLSATWRPIDALTVNATYSLLHSKKLYTPILDGTGAIGTISASQRVSGAKQPSTVEFDSTVFTFDAAYDIGENRLTYLGGFQKSDNQIYRDGDFINQFGPTHISVLSLESVQQIESHEFRFERTGDHFWIYRFGAFYSRTVNPSAPGFTASNYGIDGSCSLGLGCVKTTIIGSSKSLSKGFFTTQTFKFSPSDILEVGLRNNHSETTGSSGFVVFGNPITFPVANKFNSTTGTVNYKHYFTRDVMAYINYGTSFRPGGTDTFGAFQYSFLTPASTYFNIKPEKSRSIEVGTKAELYNKRLSVSGAVFDQHFDDYIYRLNGLFCTGAPNASTGPNANTVYATNNGTATGTACQNGSVSLNGNANVHVQGLEFSVRGRILPEWIVEVNGTYYNKANFDNATVYCNDFNGDGTPDISGTPAVQKGKFISTCLTSAALGGLPKWQLALNSDYHHPISANWEGFARGLLTIRPAFKDVINGSTAQKSNIADVFLGATSTKGLEVSLFVKNLFNDQGITGEGPFNPYNIVSIPLERRLGVQLKQSF